MLGQQQWEFSSSASSSELVSRLHALFERQIDSTRNLCVPPEYPKWADETGFSFAVTSVRGGAAFLLNCCGTFAPSNSGTKVTVRLWLARWVVPVVLGVGPVFWGPIIWVLYPVSLLFAVGSLAVMECVILAALAISLAMGGRSCRRRIEQLLSAEHAEESPAEVVPKYPWWELLGAGVFSLVGSVFSWWYLTEAERAGGIRRLPAIAAQLYRLGGKWLVVLFLAAIGTGFSAAGIWKLIRVRRDKG